jgi:hypothetical protein
MSSWMPARYAISPESDGSDRKERLAMVAGTPMRSATGRSGRGCGRRVNQYTPRRFVEWSKHAAAWTRANLCNEMQVGQACAAVVYAKGRSREPG